MEIYVFGIVKYFGCLDVVFLNVGISYVLMSIFDIMEESYECIMRVNVKLGKILFVIFFVYVYLGFCLYYLIQCFLVLSMQ